METQEVARWIGGTLRGVVCKESWGEVAWFYNPGGFFANGSYFLTIKRWDGREIRGQLSRMVAVFPGYAFGWVPKGNTGGANVHPLKPMAIPDDLKSDLGRYSVTLDVLGRLILWTLVALVAFATYKEWNHRHQSEVIENDWQNRSLPSVRDLGSVERLEILPLVGWQVRGCCCQASHSWRFEKWKIEARKF